MNEYKYIQEIISDTRFAGGHLRIAVDGEGRLKGIVKVDEVNGATTICTAEGGSIFGVLEALELQCERIVEG